MKKSPAILITLVLLLIGSFVSAQSNAIEKYFAQYVNDKDFTVVYISPKLFNLVENINIDELEDEEVAAVIEVTKGMKELRILTTDINAKERYEEARKKINTTEYETLVTVRDKDKSNFDIYIKEIDGGKIGELLMISGGDHQDEFVLISFVGNVDMDKVSTFINKIE